MQFDKKFFENHFMLRPILVEELQNNSIFTNNNIRSQRSSGIATQNSIVSFVTAPLNCYFALRSEDSIVDLLACKGNKLR